MSRNGGRFSDLECGLRFYGLIFYLTYKCDNSKYLCKVLINDFKLLVLERGSKIGL